MYLGIDIGGTKTLAACISDDGSIKEFKKFLTPHDYPAFKKKLAEVVASFTTKTYTAACVGTPGRINRLRGIGLSFGNLPWKQIPLKNDVNKITNCPVILENDANLAGLSEALRLTRYEKVLYVTISTGVGAGIITHQAIDSDLLDSEGGQILLEYKGKQKRWEDIASGKAIEAQFGTKPEDITDEKTWTIIAKNIALGLIDLSAVIQPDAIIIGGGVALGFERFHDPLKEAMDHLSTPLVPAPPIFRAKYPKEAVIYGCYCLARSIYGPTD